MLPVSMDDGSLPLTQAARVRQDHNVIRTSTPLSLGMFSALQSSSARTRVRQPARSDMFAGIGLENRDFHDMTASSVRCGPLGGSPKISSLQSHPTKAAKSRHCQDHELANFILATSKPNHSLSFHDGHSNCANRLAGYSRFSCHCIWFWLSLPKLTSRVAQQLPRGE